MGLLLYNKFQRSLRSLVLGGSLRLPSFRVSTQPAAASSIVEASGNCSSVDIVQPVILISIGVHPNLY